ncbi:hypothetical protein DFH09DRAFT_1360425 [Mycena vulgaris]|nr:hypothetical protein DFH09DRAFT_1360425 [Mycena vulgaris]
MRLFALLLAVSLALASSAHTTSPLAHATDTPMPASAHTNIDTPSTSSNIFQRWFAHSSTHALRASLATPSFILALMWICTRDTLYGSEPK